MGITLSKVAKLSNVSVSTASKAFSMSPEVNEETRNMIFSVARELGCFKKFYKAKYPKLVIAVVCPEFESLHYANVLRHVKEALDARGCEMCVGSFDFSTTNAASLFDYFTKYATVDGIIAVNCDLSNVENFDIPIVGISSKGMPEDVPQVSINTVDAIVDAVAYLKNRGVVDIGFIGERLTKSKYDNFCKALEQCGLPVNKRIHKNLNTRFEECGYRGMDKILDEGILPRAVICAYDNIAIGAMKRLSEAGLFVPDDVAIIGMDDVPLCEYLNPSLSSVKNTVREAMEFACDAIVKRIFGKPCEMNKTFEGKFIPRESSEIR